METDDIDLCLSVLGNYDGFSVLVSGTTPYAGYKLP